MQLILIRCRARDRSTFARTVETLNGRVLAIHELSPFAALRGGCEHHRERRRGTRADSMCIHGDTAVVPPSTLVDCTTAVPRLVREGAIPRAELRHAAGRLAP